MRIVSRAARPVALQVWTTADGVQVKVGDVINAVYIQGRGPRASVWQEEAVVGAGGWAETSRGHRVLVNRCVADTRKGWDRAEELGHAPLERK